MRTLPRGVRAGFAGAALIRWRGVRISASAAIADLDVIFLVLAALGAVTGDTARNAAFGRRFLFGRIDAFVELGHGVSPCSANDRVHEMVSARPCLAATVQKPYSGAARRASECSAARLAHLSGGQGVVGSNPATPTIFSLRIKAFSRTRRSASPDKNGTERHRNAR